jgi:hypothetical protein
MLPLAFSSKQSLDNTSLMLQILFDTKIGSFDDMASIGVIGNGS